MDLDFNAIGPKAQVLAERAQVASQVMALPTAQDAGYELMHDYRRYQQSTIQAYYVPVSGGPRQHFKLELSFVERVPIYPTFRANVEEKLRYRGFADDVRGLIRTNQPFNWQEASQAVLERFAFLADFDERDGHFLELARRLLGRPGSEHSGDALAQIEHPIAWLMESIPITPEAAALRVDDIRLFARG